MFFFVVALHYFLRIRAALYLCCSDSSYTYVLVTYSLSSAKLYTGQFPLLHVDVNNLNDDERDELLTRLNAETKSMCLAFGGLMSHTAKSLQNSKCTAEDLIMFFRCSDLEELANSINVSDSIPDIMSKVKTGGYWNFYNYEVLESLIHYYCEKTATVKHLDEYVAKFRSYCTRRVSEVPADAFEDNSSVGSVFKVKLDEKFSVSSTIESVKHVQYRLQQILKRKPIILVGVDKGCLQLIFRFFDGAISVDEKRSAQLKEIGVQRLTVTRQGHFYGAQKSYAGEPVRHLILLSCMCSFFRVSVCNITHFNNRVYFM